MSNWKPFESMKFEPETRAKLKAEYKKLLEKLGGWHKEFAKGRKVQLDKDLGKAPGCMADVIAGRRSISLPTLLGFLAAIDSDFPTFAKALKPEPPIPILDLPPPVPVENLLTLVQGRTKYEKLYRWASDVRITEEGFSLSLDFRLILKQAESNPARARELAGQHLKAVEEILPECLDRTSAVNLCQALAFRASPRFRISDDACDEAADLLTVAATLEGSLSRPDIRALLYRKTALLLCHLGQINTADRCARAAVELSIVDPERGALGKSLYVRSWIAKWRGSTAFALHLLRSAEFHLRDPSFAPAIRCAAIYFLIDSGEFSKAAKALEAEPFERASSLIQGHLLFYLAISSIWQLFCQLGVRPPRQNEALKQQKSYLISKPLLTKPFTCCTSVCTLLAMVGLLSWKRSLPSYRGSLRVSRRGRPVKRPYWQRRGTALSVAQTAIVI